MGSPNPAFWLGQQLKARAKLVSLWSSAQYNLVEVNFHHPFCYSINGKYDTKNYLPLKIATIYSKHFMLRYFKINQYNSD